MLPLSQVRYSRVPGVGDAGHLTAGRKLQVIDGHASDRLGQELAHKDGATLLMGRLAAEKNWPEARGVPRASTEIWSESATLTSTPTVGGAGL